MSDDWQTSEELDSHYGSRGPVALVWNWLRAIESRDYRAAWRLMDDNLRLCRAQAWIFANAHFAEVASYDRSSLATELAATEPRHDLWADFASTEVAQLAELGWSAASFAAGSRPRPLGPDLELVLMVDIQRNPEMIDVTDMTNQERERAWRLVPGPTEMIAAPFVVRVVEGEWYLAAFGGPEKPPTAGWPPDWHMG